MSQELWNVISVVIAFLFTLFLGVIGWFIKSSWSDLKTSILEMKAQLTMLAEQKDFEKLAEKVDNDHERILKLESKIGACKNCNSH